MTSHDRNGRPWAKLIEVKAGDTLIADDGFSCVSEGPVGIYQDITYGLYFNCGAGKHFLDGQVNETGHLVGLYNVEK